MIFWMFLEGGGYGKRLHLKIAHLTHRNISDTRTGILMDGNQNMKIAISGGPCSGKTTLVNELSKLGFQKVDEAAIQVIDDLNAQLGIHKQKEWRRSHFMEFQRMILAKQRELEVNVENVVYDRSVIDTVSYLLKHDEPIPEAFDMAAKKSHYDIAFICKTLKNFDERADTGRMSKYEDSLEIMHCIEKSYAMYGYSPIFIPEWSVEKRIQFILETIQYASQKQSIAQ
jgi:predicted ATPase